MFGNLQQRPFILSGVAVLTAVVLTLFLLPHLPPAFSTLLSPIKDVDVNQHRSNEPLPAPRGDFEIQQSFTAGRNGLAEVEVYVFRPETPAANGRFTLTLASSAGAPIAAQTFSSGALRPGQPLVLAFPPLPDSAGQTYLLTIGGSPQNDAGVWGYTLDAYTDGAARLLPGPLSSDAPQTAVADLRFVTRYRLLWPDALRLLGETLLQQGGLLLLALLFLPLPGCLVLLLARRQWPRLDRAAWWGTAVALGVSLWPLIWFALTLAGGRWTPGSLWAVFVGGWVVVAGVWLYGRQGSWGAGEQRSRVFPSAPLPLRPSAIQKTDVLSLLILTLGLALRLLAVRDQAFPLWVDAGRHGLITAVMAHSGQTISSYAPFLPVERFPYHFGFHTLSASLVMMTQRPLPELLLYLGQLLNALAPLAVYTAAWLFTRRRGAAVLAAFCVAVPFFFPAYYATWGRFTQLTGMLVLPVLAGLTWRLAYGARRWRRAWWLIGALAAGLFLLHFRVFLVYLPFAAVAWGMARGRNGRWLSAAGLLTVALAGVRAVQLARLNDDLAAAVSYSIPGYNAFPTSYVEVGWERYFIWLAGGLLPIVLAAWMWRRLKGISLAWTAVPIALIIWVTLLFVLLAGESLGLPETTLINLNSMYITLFAPLAIYLGALLAQFWRRIDRGPAGLRLTAVFIAATVGTAVTLFGARQQLTILNAQTVLAQPADLAGLAWLDANLPPDAKIAVNSWLWLGGTYAGSDGGAWIVPLTRRASSTPPADYIYSAALWTEVNGFNAAAVDVEDWSAPETAVWLRQQGITHIYVGAKGGFLDPATLARNPALTLLYRQNGVFIFAFE